METKYTKKDDNTLLKAVPIPLDMKALYEEREKKRKNVDDCKQYLAYAEAQLAEVEIDIAEAEKLGIVKEAEV